MENHLRAARTARGYTLASAARTIGIGEASLWKYEMGAYHVRLERLEAICDAYNCPPWELFSFERWPWPACLTRGEP